MADPAIQFTPASGPNGAAFQEDGPQHPQLPPSGQRTAPPPYRVPQATPHLEPEPQPQAVGIPTDSGLMIDPESGDRYRPFQLGRAHLRCARVIPADVMLSIVAAQQQVADKKPEDLTPAERVSALQLMGEMLTGVVWDEDADKARAALRDKRNPIDVAELAEAINRLWAEYNVGTGVGKEPTDS